MSTIISTPMQTGVAAPPAQAAVAQRADVVVEHKITVPGWINTLAEYRRWAESDEYPQSGSVSYLDGKIFVDASAEDFFSHNQTKGAFYSAFGSLLSQHSLGCFVPDRMMLVNGSANFATEPDGQFYRWETMRNGRLSLVPNEEATDYTQLEGTPDAVLEIVSDGSVAKDLIHLRDLYWKSQIPEYWLVDTRKAAIRFDILRYAADGYHETPSDDGWVRSEVLGHSFRVERSIDPLGLPQFVVQLRL